MQLWWHHQGSGILSHRIYFSVVSTGWVALFRTCKPFKLVSGHGGLCSVCCVQFSSWSTGSSSPPDMTYIVKFYITVACDHQTAKMGEISYLKWAHHRERLQNISEALWEVCPVCSTHTAMCVEALLWSTDVNISPLLFLSEPVSAITATFHVITQ